MWKSLLMAILLWACSPALGLFGQGLSVAKQVGEEVVVKVIYTAEQQKLATGFLLQSAGNLSLNAWADESTIGPSLREFRFPATTPKFYRVIVVGSGTARSLPSNVVSVEIVQAPPLVPAIIGVQ